MTKEARKWAVGAAALILPMLLAACDRGNPSGPAATASGANSSPTTAVERRETTNNAQNRIGDIITGSPGTAMNNTGAAVTGKAAAASAQRLLDGAQASLQSHDWQKAQTIVDQLKQPGMYDKLSASMKQKVDAFAKQLAAAGK